MRLSAGVLFFLCASAANANTKSPKECFPTVLSTITHINARPATKEELELFADMDAKEIRLHNKLTEYETYETFDTQHHPASIIVPNPNNPSEKILIFRKQMTQNHALKIDGLFYETQPHSEMLAKFLSEKLGFSEKVPETYT